MSPTASKLYVYNSSPVSVCVMVNFWASCVVPVNKYLVFPEKATVLIASSTTRVYFISLCNSKFCSDSSDDVLCAVAAYTPLELMAQGEDSFRDEGWANGLLVLYTSQPDVLCTMNHLPSVL